MNTTTNPENYINRELSLLAFNYRVLQQANFDEVPLLERMRYLCISSSNLDEFFEIRVAGLKSVAESSNVPQIGYDNINIGELLDQIANRAHELVAEQYLILNDVLLPQLEQNNIRFLKRDRWNETQANWLKEFFATELLPMLSPIGLDPAHPFPRIQNKSLNFIITLKGKDAFGRNRDMAILQAPRALPRIIQLPPGIADSGFHDFVFLSSIIHAHIDELLTGMEVNGCYQFRVTRNSDLLVDEEVVDDLLRAMEGELPSRRYGDEVRLETADNCPDEVDQFLLEQFGLSRVDLYKCPGPVNLNRLMALPDLVDLPALKFPPFKPKIPEKISRYSDIFKAIRKSDILLHHPFESFVPVIDFVRQAAQDPNVIAIKQTLYRTGSNSKIIEALISAARAGKEVTVVIELRARFDEEANIQLTYKLQEAGAHVVYGVVGYKTHAKMIQVVRREEGKFIHYIHLGTGNYHAGTARLYTDYGLFTCDPDIAQDVHQIFLQLTSLGKSRKLLKLLQSPFTLYNGIIEKIEREAQLAKEGKPAKIVAKMNSLVEPTVIDALYKASQTGVKICLIIRGICCLQPGIEGVSDNIRVLSIIGRFLEHTRIYYFQNGGNDEMYASSADWMVRNLHRRVESCFPVEKKALMQRMLKELELYMSDNTQAWELQANGDYKRRQPELGQTALSAQKTLLEQLSEN